MSTAFQSNAFQDNAFQIEEGISEVISEVISGVRRRFRKYDDPHRHLEALIPQLRPWKEEQKREKQERKRRHSVFRKPDLVEISPIPAFAFSPLDYMPELRIQEMKEVSRQLKKRLDRELEEDNELLEFLGVIDG